MEKVEIKDGILGLLQAVREAKPQFRNKTDALIFLIHLIAKQKGYICVGCGDENDESASGLLIPPSWQQSKDSYSFRYRHPKSTNTFVVKFLPVENFLICHGLIKETNKMSSFEIPNVNDYIKEVSLTSYETLYTNIDNLITLVSIELLNNFVTPDKPTQTQTQQQSRTQERNDPLREPPRRGNTEPILPDTGGYYPPSFGTPFGIGRGDVFPMVPGGPPIGWGPDSGGNLIGPGHPGFGPGVRDPYAVPRRFPGRGQYPPGVPPGARFDPFGPPGTNRSDPDRDEPPPPGYDNMFL